MGGDKAMAELDGTALLLHPLRALAAVTDAQAVVAKRDTRLPALPPGVEVWLEPDTPRHPLTGVLHALRAAAGRPVLCCAVDLPRLDPPTLQALLDAGDGREACAPTPRMRDVVIALGALEVTFADARPFANANAPRDLRRLQSG